jgi:hypothetical protein
MAKWSSLGHGMRRRLGLPSNHLESTGSKMTRKHATSDEIYQSQANAGSPRIPMGMSAYAVSPAPAPQGTLIPKKNLQAGDPTNPGSKVNRVNLPYDQERIGAAYRVKTNFLPTTDPVAGATTRNGRIVPSVAGRQNPNFVSGIQASEL